jgi:hypothetical protein
MIDRKCCHLQSIALVHGSFLHDVSIHGRSGGRLVFGEIAANVDVGSEKLDHAVGQLARALRAVQLEGHGPPLEQPTGVEEIGESGSVVRVQMRKEHRLHVRHSRMQSRQTHGDSASRVDDKIFAVHYQHRRRTGNVRQRNWITRAQQNRLDRTRDSLRKQCGTEGENNGYQQARHAPVTLARKETNTSLHAGIFLFSVPERDRSECRC